MSEALRSVASSAGRVLCGLGLVYALVALALFLVQRRLIYPIAHRRPAPARPPLDGGQWWARAIEEEGGAGGQREAIWLPAAEASAAAPAPLLVYLHGNGELIDGAWRRAAPWRRRGFHVLVPEYRGYGRTGGGPAQEAIAADVIAWIDEARARPEVDDEALVIHGISLGGAVAGAVARRREPRALVLESTLSSMGAMARRFGMPGFLARDPYRTAALLRQRPIPTLLMHGRADEVIPFPHGAEIARSGSHVEFHPCDGGHYACPSPARLWALTDAFLERQGLGLGAPQPEDPPESEQVEP